MSIKDGEDFQITNIEQIDWQGDCNDGGCEYGDIQLYTDEDISGSFDIIFFQLKANKVGSGSVSLNSILFYDEQYLETIISSSSIAITIKEEQKKEVSKQLEEKKNLIIMILKKVVMQV